MRASSAELASKRVPAIFQKATNKRSWTRDLTSIGHLRAAFGGMHLSEMTPLMIERYKAQRNGGVKPATVNRELACLKQMFAKAIEWGRATQNPAQRVKLLRENNQRLRHLSRQEMKDLLNAAGLHLKPILVIALYTVMRKREILKLRWENVDPGRGLIIFKDTKNGQWREIPMNETLTETLETVPRRGPYVFCNEAGRPFRNVRKPFAMALNQVGIEDFRFQDLRHTFASILVMAGVDLTTVKDLLGHKTLEMTFRYSHLSPSHKRDAVARLENQMDTNMDTSLKLVKGAVG